nr:hypothetical protein [Tanacetum cinerariifolium]
MSITRQRCCLQRKIKMKKFFLAKDQAWMESRSDSDQEINENMVFMAQIEKVLLIQRLAHRKYAKLEAERYEYMIRYSGYFDNNKQYRKQITDQQVLYDKMSVQLVELDKHGKAEASNDEVRWLGRKGIGFENPSYFEKEKDFRPTLYDEKVIGLGLLRSGKNCWNSMKESREPG